MAAAYSMDLRQRVIDAYDRNEGSQAVLAEWYEISERTIAYWLSQRHAHGSFAPRPRGGGAPPNLDQAAQTRLKQAVEEKPDRTLEELIEIVGVPMSIACMWGWCQRLNLSFKKKTDRAAEQDRPDVKQQREQWKAQQRSFQPSRRQIWFLDEFAVKTNMARRYGRAPRGERVEDSVPHGHYKTTSVIGTMNGRGPGCSRQVDGAVNSKVFRTFIQEQLVPQLRKGDIVVMDNLSSHKASGVVEMIEQAGATVRYLPPYSPDLNPIEKMISKVKQWLRSTAARTQEALTTAIDQAIQTVTASDAQGYFASCGYPANA